jgi:hypothetical protein
MRLLQPRFLELAEIINRQQRHVDGGDQTGVEGFGSGDLEGGNDSSGGATMRERIGNDPTARTVTIAANQTDFVGHLLGTQDRMIEESRSVR